MPPIMKNNDELQTTLTKSLFFYKHSQVQTCFELAHFLIFFYKLRALGTFIKWLIVKDQYSFQIAKYFMHPLSFNQKPI